MMLSSIVFGANFDSDVPTDVQAQMVEDLGFMATVTGATPSALHQSIYGDISGSTYDQFFNSHVKSVGLHTCGNPNAVACVIPFLDSSKMWITKNYIKFSHPQIARLMIVYHEARHTEGSKGFWQHATCPVPFNDANGNAMKSIWTGAPLAGEPACDSKVGGSYGSTVILLKNIGAHCTNCTEKTKMDADLYAMDQLGRLLGQAKSDALADMPVAF